MMNVATRAAIATPLVCLGFLLPGAASADILGPDAFGYVADTDAPFDYEEISGSGTEILSNDDDAILQIPIGFTFFFYGSAYTDLYVSTNGFALFAPGGSDFSNDNLETDTDNRAAIVAPLWDDWHTGGAADAIYYQTRGTAGNRRLVVEWHLVRHFSGSAAVMEFQLILFESGDIEFHYENVVGNDSAGDDNGGSATVGIRNAQPPAIGDGDVLQVSFNEAVISNGQAIRFCENSCESLVDGDFNYLDQFNTPEPTTIEEVGGLSPLTLAGFGLAGLVGFRRRR